MSKTLNKTLNTILSGALALSIAAGGTGTIVHADPVKDVTGTWYIDHMVDNNIEYDRESLYMMGMTVTMTFDEGGSFHMTYQDSDPIEGNWDLNGQSGSITINNDPVNFYLEEDGTISIKNGYEMYFTNEEPDIARWELAPVVKDPDLSDFNGEWESDVVVTGDKTLPAKLLGKIIHLSIKDGVVEYYEYSAKRQDDSTEETEAESEEPLFVKNATLSDGVLTLENQQAGTHYHLTVHTDGTLTEGYANGQDTSSGETEAEDSSLMYTHFKSIGDK